MGAGRCSGCGFEDRSSKIVIAHINAGCEAYTKQFISIPSSVRDPEEEYRAHQEWLRSPEGQVVKEEQVAEKRQAHLAKQEAKRAVEQKRWGVRPPE
jgi:ABC-type uncharacterized transport system YnjBCD substrate-binding protein